MQKHEIISSIYGQRLIKRDKKTGMTKKDTQIVTEKAGLWVS